MISAVKIYVEEVTYWGTCYSWSLYEVRIDFSMSMLGLFFFIEGGMTEYYFVFKHCEVFVRL